jgi:hypothetical protein
MPFPFSRNTTYVAGTPPAPKANDLNEIQDYLAGLYNGDVIVFDHFTGAAVDSGRWTAASSPTVVDDSANGAFGTAKFDGASTQTLVTTGLALGTVDFHMRARLRVTGVTGASARGFGIYMGNQRAWFQIDGGVSTVDWQAAVNGSYATPSGTTPSIESFYQTFDIYRSSGSITLAVDGVVFHSEAYATDLDGGYPAITTSGAGILWFDYITLVLT